MSYLLLDHLLPKLYQQKALATSYASATAKSMPEPEFEKKMHRIQPTQLVNENTTKSKFKKINAEDAQHKIKAYTYTLKLLFNLLCKSCKVSGASSCWNGSHCWSLQNCPKIQFNFSVFWIALIIKWEDFTFTVTSMRLH